VFEATATRQHKPLICLALIIPVRNPAGCRIAVVDLRFPSDDQVLPFADGIVANVVRGSPGATL